MAVRIAEYFGQNVANNDLIIKPVYGNLNCPFMNSLCTKLSKGNKPVCSVRRQNGDVWIVCKDRLCATLSGVPLSSYQIDILMEVARCIFGDDVEPEDIAIRREASIPVVTGSIYHADYVMMNIGNRGRTSGQKRVVLEMQGGGETSSTGSITRLIDSWEADSNRTNASLSISVNANPIVTNAWRRQQEQFIIKGNIAQQTGAGLVFCVGKPIFDYLWERIRDAHLNDLRLHNWTLALIAFDDVSAEGSESLKFSIDRDRILFTNYVTFVQTLINQGRPYPEMFEGEFSLLNGMNINL